MNCSTSTRFRATPSARVARRSRRHSVVAAQGLAGRDRHSHQGVLAQGRVVVEVLMDEAQAIQPLHHQVPQFMDDEVGVAWIVQGIRHRLRQADLRIHLLQQRQSTVGTERASLETGCDDASSQMPKTHLIGGTL
jgi:hypothetical protein